MTVITLETMGLTKYYGSFCSVDGIDLSVEKGEIFGFLGPNGAGKTTTIRLLLDLIRPTSGSYRIFGKEKPHRDPTIREEIGNLPGEIGFYPNMTGKEFLGYFLRYHPMGFEDNQGRLCERFKLDQAALDKKIKYYSKGMKQKIGLIQAMQRRPRLLILDEPSEALDPLMQQALYTTLQELKKEGCTIFLSSHILAEVEKMCDRVAIIRKGRIQTVENIAVLKQKMVRRLTVFAESIVLSQISKLPHLRLKRMDSTSAEYQFNGEVSQLLQGLAPLPIQDIIFPEPELEDIFLEFY
ncbi:MAG: hypothetical protein B6244_03885 [Candidatus Cloacimonetes bacterium 4572_55]|nr:MAG: hypothetical protein B6244_03885 [Candidatus Cloacimonetes bacterium 4572_55]